MAKVRLTKMVSMLIHSGRRNRPGEIGSRKWRAMWRSAANQQLSDSLQLAAGD